VVELTAPSTMFSVHVSINCGRVGRRIKWQEHAVSLSPFSTVADLKRAVEAASGLSAKRLRLPLDVGSDKPPADACALASVVRGFGNDCAVSMKLGPKVEQPDTQPEIPLGTEAAAPHSTCTFDNCSQSLHVTPGVSPGGVETLRTALQALELAPQPAVRLDGQGAATHGIAAPHSNPTAGTSSQRPQTQPIPQVEAEDIVNTSSGGGGGEATDDASGAASLNIKSLRKELDRLALTNDDEIRRRKVLMQLVAALRKAELESIDAEVHRIQQEDPRFGSNPFTMTRIQLLSARGQEVMADNKQAAELEAKAALAAKASADIESQLLDIMRLQGWATVHKDSFTALQERLEPFHLVANAPVEFAQADYGKRAERAAAQAERDEQIRKIDAELKDITKDPRYYYVNPLLKRLAELSTAKDSLLASPLVIGGANVPASAAAPAPALVPAAAPAAVLAPALAAVPRGRQKAANSGGGGGGASVGHDDELCPDGPGLFTDIQCFAVKRSNIVNVEDQEVPVRLGCALLLWRVVALGGC
jgi:hypothetical protein